jgi:hypothetical protein
MFHKRRCLVLAAALAVLTAPAAAGERSGKLLERIFARMDADGNGAISAAEGEAAAVRQFERRDADGDGFLSKAEFAAHERAGRLSEEQQAKLGAHRAQRFAAMDENDDGRVAAAEFFAAAQRRFTAADRNGDGQVTLDEIRARGETL